ncbi:MAG: rhodanese-like domain-containing protein, partial [Quisquiliibacterium sp.]
MKFITDNLFLIAIALASGLMLLWPVLQRRTGGASLDTLAATRLMNDSHPVVLDVRETAEFSSGHLPGSRNIPLSELEKRAGDLPKGKAVR